MDTETSSFENPRHSPDGLSQSCPNLNREEPEIWDLTAIRSVKFAKFSARFQLSNHQYEVQSPKAKA